MQTPSTSQEASQVQQITTEDIFANIPHVLGDFVHCLIQNGALNFLQQIYKEGNLWKPRDCRILRTSPNEASYKEFTKCLTLILTAANSYPLKTLQRELLTYVAKQLPFFIFPSTRCRNKKQNHQCIDKDKGLMGDTSGIRKECKIPLYHGAYQIHSIKIPP